MKGFCRDEGLEMDSSIDHFGIAKGTCLRRLGKRSQLGERHGKGEWVLSKTLEVFQRQYLRTGAQKTHHYGPCATQDLVGQGLRDLPNSKNQDQCKKKQASFDIFLEVTKRWDERGEDDKTLNKLRVDVILGNKEAKRRVKWKRRVVIVKNFLGISKTTPQNWTLKKNR